MGEFVHLHLHTEYSLLDGAAKISEIAAQALKDGQDAVAITDHGVMYGVVEFYNEMKKHGIKPIIGCECYVAPESRFVKDGKQHSSGNHLVLLCKNATGYKNLCYMVSESFINGFYMKPRIDMELIRRYHEGLIALSGCVAGKIPQLILAGDMSAAEKYAEEMKEIFGGDFYLEVQNHGLDEELRVAYGVKLIGDKLDIPLVATNDVHYIERTDSEAQAVLMCIQTNNVITDGRPFGFETDEFYFKTASQMKILFSSFAGAIENTVKIAEKCNFDFEFDKLHLPSFSLDGGATHGAKLRADAYAGLEQRKSDGRLDLSARSESDYVARLEYELSVIDEMGFNAYYLIVADFVNYAKKQGIPVGPGRGSGAGSLVAFCVGITDVDPLAFGLLFERFLNPERVSMPDFDIDFCYNRREEVIDYVKRKYGVDHVAQIVTFGTLAARAVVRDVGRALGMPYNRVDSVAKLIPREANDIAEALKTKELKALYDADGEVRRLIDLAERLEGMPRHASTHAAGVVITEKPTWQYVPLSYSGTGIVTQFDMTTDAKLGLVKFDFLGLRYLTVLDDAEKLIKKRNADFSLSKLSFGDEATFKLLSEARTDGVFQLESSGMKQVLVKLAPSNLEDVIACIALYRPGPMDSIDTFIARKQGKEALTYDIPQLKEILDVTYGCIVYQEQVMQIFRLLAGYSFARADIVRRAMSKKDSEVMLAECDSFIAGCRERGISEDAAAVLFDQMVDFAKYAFNKSHATAYAVLSYRTAYLKAHYPAEYFSALLTSVLDTTQKLRDYVADVQKYNVRVLPPDINQSEVDFCVYDGNIRYGLLAIKNVGRNVAELIVEERKRGRYSSFDDFVHRVSSCELNKKTVESLIKCGVFDSLGVTRSSLLASFEDILNYEGERRRNNVDGQMDLFSLGDTSVPQAPAFNYPSLPEYSLKELLAYEKESSGMYFSGHMIDNFIRHISELCVDLLSDILQSVNDDGFPENEKKYKDKCKVSVAGIISSVKTKVLKNGDTMAFLRLEDKTGEIEVIVFARQYARFSSELFLENAVLVEGSLSEEEEETRILLSNLVPLISNSDFALKNRAATTDKKLYIKLDSMSDDRIRAITRMAILHSGKTEIIVFDTASKKYSVLKDMRISADEKVIARFKVLFGEENVVFK